MPIFQDDLARGRSTPPTQPEFPFRDPPPAEIMRRKASEESIRTELCEGPVSVSPSEHGASPSEKDQGPKSLSQGVSDRAELIERLKRGESPTWLPNRHVCVHITPDSIALFKS